MRMVFIDYGNDVIDPLGLIIHGVCFLGVNFFCNRVYKKVELYLQNLDVS